MRTPVILALLAATACEPPEDSTPTESSGSSSSYRPRSSSSARTSSSTSAGRSSSTSAASGSSSTQDSSSVESSSSSGRDSSGSVESSSSAAASSHSVERSSSRVESSGSSARDSSSVESSSSSVESSSSSQASSSSSTDWNIPCAAGAVRTASGWCWDNPRPQGGHLLSVWGAAEDDVWLGGDHGVVYHWDGTQLSYVPTPADGPIMGIWGSAADDVWMVATRNDLGLLMHWDGTGWDATWDAQVPLWNITGRGRGEVWVSGTGYVGRADGQTLTAVAMPLEVVGCGSVPGVGAAPGGDLWVTDCLGEIYRMHPDGTVESTPSDTARPLRGVFVRAEDDVWAFGEDVVHWDGNQWTARLRSRPVTALWGSGPNNVWASASAEAVLLHWGGSRWEATSEFPGRTWSLWGIPGTAPWGVGDNGLLLRLQGSRWVSQRTDLTDGYPGWFDLWGSGRTEAWAVGGYGLVAHWDGTTWQRWSVDLAETLAGIHGTGPQDVWAVGMALAHWDGVRWTRTESPVPTTLLNAVWMASASQGFAVAEDGTVLRYQDAAWEVAASVPGQALRDVSGSGPTNVLAVGTLGTALRWDGSQWHPLDTPVPNEDLVSVWVADPTLAWAVTAVGSVLHWDGTAWTEANRFPRSSQTPLLRVRGSGRDNVWAAGWGPRALHYDGANWSEVNTGLASVTSGLWVPEAGTVLATGWGGMLAHWAP